MKNPHPEISSVENVDYTIHIGTGLVEVGPQHIISTTTYNAQFPGPLLRFKEGQRMIVDIYIDTNIPEQFHWHGQMVPVDVDGSAEEGTPYIPARGMRREIFILGPSGFRFYHTHVIAGNNLDAGQYNSEVGPVYIEPKNEERNYDREEFIVLKEFEPYFMRGGDMAMDFLSGKQIPELKEMQEKAEKSSAGKPKGYEVGYKIFTINGHQLGHGKPVRVKYVERILFHILNGSATEIHSLAMPGHNFKVIALDGNPVPKEAAVLWLGTAERISAIVEMKKPGVWIMGDLSNDDRGNGMGIVIEYENKKGKPQWIKPKPFKWDYTIFGKNEMLFAKQQATEKGFNQWTINGVAYVTKQFTKNKLSFFARMDFYNPDNKFHITSSMIILICFQSWELLEIALVFLPYFFIFMFTNRNPGSKIIRVFLKMKIIFKIHDAFNSMLPTFLISAP